MGKRGKKLLLGTMTIRQNRKRKKGEQPYSNHLIQEPYTRDESAYEDSLMFAQRCGGGRRIVRK